MKKKILLLSILVIASLASFAQKQEKIYYDKDWKGCSKSKAEFYRIVNYDENGKPVGKIIDYFITGELQSEIEGALNIDKIDGKLLTYWNNGNAKRIDEYTNGELISGKCFNIEGEEIPYFDYEIPPKFNGGEVALSKFLSEKKIYPEIARIERIEGEVSVQFVVDIDGKISDVKILKGVHKKLDKEAMRVVRAMPRWTPGNRDGEAVKAYFVISITFTSNYV